MAFWITLCIGIAFLLGWAFGESNGYHEAYQEMIEKNLRKKFGDEE